MHPDLARHELNRSVTVFRDWHREARNARVLGLRVLPSGPRYRLDQFRYGDEPKGGLVVGSDAKCDIPVPDPNVARYHCLLMRDAPALAVRDCNSQRGTFVNATRVEIGELPVGGLLTVGATTLLAFGERGAAQEIWIGAASLQDFIENAERLYGSVRRAAIALGVPESTLRGWLETEKFRKLLPEA